ncbi:MAG TPA: fumarylacetoacetate hydrolase family protein [Alphaproteobacteria bacterium]|nr:fumarylacetoacetate hydrolase family protein [Alphaproteobacteria bacterium]
MYHLLNTKGPGGAARACIAVNGTVFDLEKIMGPVNTIGLVADWETQAPRLEAIANEAADGGHQDAAVGPVAEAELLAPLLYPLSLICAGANYAKHVLEMTGSEFDKSTRRPYFFLKLPRQGIIGPGAPIPLPHTSEQVDWEVELAAVIGWPARNVKAGEALQYVAGYTIMNDVSARDLGRRPDWPNWGMDWLGHKSFDGSAPMGPWMVPASQITDPHVLDIRLWVNDELQQDSNTSDLIFDVAEQIEYLSELFTLHPGDVISTGTPSGVGRPRGLFLKPGDVVRMEIECIGEMTNPVIKGE